MNSRSGNALLPARFQAEFGKFKPFRSKNLMQRESGVYAWSQRRMSIRSGTSGATGK